jgi:hypothetical protein
MNICASALIEDLSSSMDLFNLSLCAEVLASLSFCRVCVFVCGCDVSQRVCVLLCDACRYMCVACAFAYTSFNARALCIIDTQHTLVKFYECMSANAYIHNAKKET